MSCQLGCVEACGFVNSGAQSDSEVVEAAVVADGSSDRGYTSDSELYDAPKRDSPLSSSDTKLKPSSGSWLMVSWGKRIVTRNLFAGIHSI